MSERFNASLSMRRRTIILSSCVYVVRIFCYVCLGLFEPTRQNYLTSLFFVLPRLLAAARGKKKKPNGVFFFVFFLLSL